MGDGRKARRAMRRHLINVEGTLFRKGGKGR
jgi:DNA-binding FadR family transcriptional regulator